MNDDDQKTMRVRFVDLEAMSMDPIFPRDLPPGWNYDRLLEWEEAFVDLMLTLMHHARVSFDADPLDTLERLDVTADELAHPLTVAETRSLFLEYLAIERTDRFGQTIAGIAREQRSLLPPDAQPLIGPVAESWVDVYRVERVGQTCAHLRCLHDDEVIVVDLTLDGHRFQAGTCVASRIVEAGSFTVATSTLRLTDDTVDTLTGELEAAFASFRGARDDFMRGPGIERLLRAVFRSVRLALAATPELGNEGVYDPERVGPQGLLRLHAAFEDLRDALETFCEDVGGYRMFEGVDAEGRLYRVEGAEEAMHICVFDDEAAWTAYEQEEFRAPDLRYRRACRMPGDAIHPKDLMYLRGCGLRPQMQGWILAESFGQNLAPNDVSDEDIEILAAAAVWAARALREGFRQTAA